MNLAGSKRIIGFGSMLKIKGIFGKSFIGWRNPGLICCYLGIGLRFLMILIGFIRFLVILIKLLN
jgi:hypothetical protein